MAIQGSPLEHIHLATTEWGLYTFSADNIRPKAARWTKLALEMKRMTILTVIAGIGLSYYLFPTGEMSLSWEHFINYVPSILPLIIPLVSFFAQLKIQEKANYFRNHLAHLEDTAENAEKYARSASEYFFPKRKDLND